MCPYSGLPRGDPPVNQIPSSRSWLAIPLHAELGPFSPSAAGLPLPSWKEISAALAPSLMHYSLAEVGHLHLHLVHSLGNRTCLVVHRAVINSVTFNDSTVRTCRLWLSAAVYWLQSDFRQEYHFLDNRELNIRICDACITH